VLWLGYGVVASELTAADLVVSAGGDTLAANITAAVILGVPNIFYGSVRRFRPLDFSLVLTSHARNAALPRHVRALKPSPLDPASMPPITRADPATAGAVPSALGLLVGGNTDGIHYRDADWARLLDYLKAQTAAAGTRWMVSNSRRTPAPASAALRKLAAAPSSPIVTFIDVRTAGSGTLGELFARSEAILCTVDSSSMVSEAIWLRRPVLVIAPQTAALPDNEQEYQNYLEANGWMRSLAIAELTPQRVAAELRQITPLAANPLERLAATVAERLPQLFVSGG
jgi:hypothetical protein